MRIFLIVVGVLLALFGVACGASGIGAFRSVDGDGYVSGEGEMFTSTAALVVDTAEFRESYRQHRPMVERSIAWLVRRGGRKVRYRGIARNHIGLAHRCAAINLHRLINLGLTHNTDSWTLATCGSCWRQGGCRSPGSRRRTCWRSVPWCAATRR